MSKGFRIQKTRPAWGALMVGATAISVSAQGNPHRDVTAARNQIRSDTARQVTGSGEHIRSVVAGGEATFELMLLPVAEWPGGTYGHGGAYSNADINHNVLTVSSGGFRVFWNAMYRNWDPGFVGPNANDGRDDIELRNLQGMIDSAGLSNSIGSDLARVVQPCANTAQCYSIYGEPFGSWGCAGFCPQFWVNYSAARAPSFSTPFDTESCGAPTWDRSCDFAQSCLAKWFGSHDPDLPGEGIFCGQRDTGVPHYFGTLALDVPADAKGTYTLEWVSDPDVTLATQTFGNELIPFAALVPGVLVIPTGACCHGVGTPEAGCMDDLSAFECAETGGSFSAGAECDGDVDGDGVDAACGDHCPMDPDKLLPGQCGCGVSDADSDGDTVPDCVDQCPGLNDLADVNDDGIPDCILFPAIPTTTEWGLTILALMLLIGAKIRSNSSTKCA